MHLPASFAVAEHLELLPEVGSTNAELVARASAGPLPAFSAIATLNQTAGRGRLGRTWTAPPGRSLAVSVLLPYEKAPTDLLGWMPLAAGLAMTRAVASLVSGEHRVALKWPNDVQVDGLKISGLLAELVPAAGAIVVGAGLNLTMTDEELPTETSTSLTLMGAQPDELVDAALAAYLTELRVLHARLLETCFDADGSGVRSAVAAACGTLGRDVRVELPGGGELLGTALDIDLLGRLVVRGPDGEIAVAAGDVTHLRLR